MGRSVAQLAMDDCGMWDVARQTDAVSAPAEAFCAPTLATLFRHSAANHAARTALQVDGESVSYRELLGLATQIAHGLITAGYGFGAARCAILGNRGLIDFAGIIGALLARCTYVPLNSRHPPQRLAQIVHEAHVPVIVTDRHS